MKLWWRSLYLSSPWRSLLHNYLLISSYGGDLSVIYFSCHCYYYSNYGGDLFYLSCGGHCYITINFATFKFMVEISIDLSSTSSELSCHCYKNLYKLN